MTDDPDEDDDPDDRPDRLFPESEPVDDPADVPDSETTEEEPMDSFGRVPDADGSSDAFEGSPFEGQSPEDADADRSATDSSPDDGDRGADGLDERNRFGDVDVRSGGDEVGDREFGGVSTGGESDDGGPASDGPLGDLAERIREKREGVEEDSDDLFEEVDVGEVDEETLWQQVASEEEFVVEEPVDREDVVAKSTYCEKCEFFTGPPRVRCTHEGTTIVEMTDLEHFRVRNCPVVLEEEALENIND